MTRLVVPPHGTFHLPIILLVINDDSYRGSVPGEDQSKCLLQISVNDLTFSTTNPLSLYRVLPTGKASFSLTEPTKPSNTKRIGTLEQKNASIKFVKLNRYDGIIKVFMELWNINISHWENVWLFNSTPINFFFKFFFTVLAER